MIVKKVKTKKSLGALLLATSLLSSGNAIGGIVHTNSTISSTNVPASFVPNFQNGDTIIIENKDALFIRTNATIKAVLKPANSEFNAIAAFDNYISTIGSIKANRPVAFGSDSFTLQQTSIITLTGQAGDDGIVGPNDYNGVATFELFDSSTLNINCPVTNDFTNYGQSVVINVNDQLNIINNDIYSVSPSLTINISANKSLSALLQK